MSATFVFEPDLVGIHELLFAPGTVSALAKVGEKVLNRAIATAPVGPSHRRDRPAGSYRAGLMMRHGEDTLSAYSDVVGTAPHTLYLEFGTSDTPAFATLRRSLLGRGALSARSLMRTVGGRFNPVGRRGE